MQTNSNYSLRNELPITSLVASQINRIMEHGTKKELAFFEEGIDRLIDLLPPEVEKIVLEYKVKHNVVYDISIPGKEKYVQLFSEIKKQLHACNIVWNKGGNYPVGHD